MRPPKEIDDSFRWDKDQIAWVQDSTGMIVTQQYIDAMNIPITNTAYIARGKPSLLKMLWDDLPHADRKDFIDHMLSGDNGRTEEHIDSEKEEINLSPLEIRLLGWIHHGHLINPSIEEDEGERAAKLVSLGLARETIADFGYREYTVTPKGRDTWCKITGNPPIETDQ